MVLLAILVGAGRLLLPEIGQYRSDIEQLLGDVLERPVRIASVDAQWQGLKPRLHLQHVSVLDGDGKQPLLYFTEVRASLDLLASLLQLRPVLGDMTAVVDTLAIERRASGEITFAGFSGSAPDSALDRAEIAQQALQWLFSIEHLDIELGRLIWRDGLLNNKPLMFDSLRLQLRNGEQRHQLDAAVLLPARMGEDLTIAFDMKGDIEAAWSATLYVEGKGVQLAQWINDQGVDSVRFGGGHADFRSWSEWGNGHLQRVSGDLSARHVKFLRSAARQTNVATPLNVHTLFGQFIWQRETQGWRLDVDRFALNLGGRTWPASRLAVAYDKAEQTRTFTAQSDFLRLEDIDALISACGALPDALHEALQNLQPRGDLRQSYAQVSLPEGQPSSYLISTRGEDLAIKPWRSLPGISGVDGLVTLNETRGAIDLRTTGLRYDSRGIFREPLMMDSVNGRLTWQQDSDGLHIVGDALHLKNSDIDVTAALQLDIPGSGQAPFMRLRADYKNGNAASASRYFPVVIMRPELINWLDDAIVAGRIPSGYARVEGRLDKALFLGDPQASKQQKSHFEIGFSVKDAIFDYLPEWPRIENAEADVLFKGRGMKINVTGGKLLNSSITTAQIAIEDMVLEPVVMTIDGQVSAAADEMLRYVAQSPLKPVLQEFSNLVSVSGMAKLDLHLDLPLSDACCGFDGTLHFNDNQLNVADSAVQLDHLQGSLRFNNDGITSPLIRGRIMGAGARFTVASINDPARKFIRIDASGDVAGEHLGDLLNISSSNPFSGETSWDARLDIGDSTHRSHLSIESRLTGMAVDLPYPLTKPASSSRLLRLSMELPFQDGLGRLSYGDDVNGVVQFSVHDGQLGVRRGEVKVGGGVARLPQGDGVSLSGALPYLSADDYRKWMVSLFDQAKRSARKPAEKEGRAASRGYLQQVNLRLDKLDVVGRQLSNVVLNAEKEVDHWQLQLASDEVAGVIQLPDSTAQPLVMNLDYIKLTRVADEAAGDAMSEEDLEKGVSEGAESVDPRQLPPLRIDSKRFIYDGRDFGQLSLQTSRHPVGLQLEKVGLISRHMVVTAHGTWIVVNGKQSSSFNVSAQTDDLGDSLEMLGFKKSIRGGEGKGSALLSWPGSPAQFSAKGLDGTLNINLEDGVVVDVEPGAGRLFGLFSFQALPRRLILDFSDLFSSGFEFDKIKGSFSIEGGNAYTSDLFMQGTAAKITIEGRVGLGKKDYDQTVTVTPEISSTLPVIGALLSSVNVGAAIWALQRVFAPDLDKKSQVKYRVSGPWSDPQVEPLP